MAYFYVKNSLGTRTTGGGLTKQTGSFTALGASNVYATITAAITDGATSGDFICVSDAHSYGATGPLTYSGPTSGDFLYIVSVDDANCDSYSKAAAYQEDSQGSTAGDLDPDGRISFHGMYFKAQDSFQIGGSVSTIFNNCVLEVYGTVSKWNVTSDGAVAVLHNCELKGLADSELTLISGANFQMIGGSVTTATDLIHGSFASGGTWARFKGVDLSSVSGYLIPEGGSAAATDDMLDVVFEGCKLNASVTYKFETLENYSHRLQITNSSDSSAGAEYQFHQSGYGGAVDDDTSFYRDSSTAFPSVTKISLKCVTDTNATPAAPFWFDMPTRYAALSSTSTDNITIYLLTSATLYDSDVWAEVVYPDGTNKQTYNYISTRHTDIMDTNGTGLTTNTETWTGRTTENRYQITLDTSTDAGADCVPIIRVYVAKASTTIYFCPSIELS